jgi:hypothetical protein
MRKLVILCSLFLLSALLTEAEACTSAIVTGKVTPDGRPLLWKHRDTGQEQNRMAWFTGSKYSFLALEDSPGKDPEVWTGSNEVGFSIMNTASYNIKDDDIKEMDQEGALMFMALGLCKNLADFERFLDTLSRPLRVEANFGVIDAEGGAAYYEVNNHSYKKLDVNDPMIAPLGYLVVTNYSYTGRFNEGMGYIRQQTALELFARMAPAKGITPFWIVQEASRSFYHSLLGIDLRKSEHNPNASGGWFIDQDFIPRKSSSASIVVQGVMPGEDPAMTIMWTVLGYPPGSVMLPLWPAAGKDQPALLLQAADSENAPLCMWAVALKQKTFSIERGNGSRYFHWALMHNEEGSGYMQQLMSLETEIYRSFLPKIAVWREKGLDGKDLQRSYLEISEKMNQLYNRLLP